MSPSSRTIIYGAFALAAVSAVAVSVLYWRSKPVTEPSASSGETQDGRSTAGATPMRSEGNRNEVPAAVSSTASAEGLEMPAEHAKASTPATPPHNVTGGAKPRYQPGPSKYRNARRPETRTILARVGLDEQAEAMWLQSINDPSVPAKEREDLIEDLNEDGLSDPAKPSGEDLVLIKSRIQLIDRLLPSAMDKVNEDAFKEARKDLVNMRNRLEGESGN